MPGKNKRSEQWNMCKREGCGTLFHPWANKLTQEYCGNRCKCIESRKHVVMVKKVRPPQECPECQTMFVPRRAQHRTYCGPKCGNAYTLRCAQEANAARNARIIADIPQSKGVAKRLRTRYYQGKVCPKNHARLRYTKSGKCVACVCEYDLARGGRKSAKWPIHSETTRPVLLPNWGFGTLTHKGAS